MRRTLALFVLALALPGCQSAPTELEARVIEMDIQLARIEGRLDAMTTHGARLQAAEAALALPSQDDQLLTRLLDLETRLLDLQGRLSAQPSTPTPARPGPETETGGERLIDLGPAPPGVERAAPRQGLPVKVVATGSGGMLLVEDPDTAQLVRVELLGVLAPRRTEDYAAQPGLRQRFEDALGQDRVASDDAYEISQQHLELLLAEARVTLEYPAGQASRSVSGAVTAYVVAQRGGERVDVNAAMLRDGYALAAPRNGRYREYAVLEREARAEGRGLFAAAQPPR